MPIDPKTIVKLMMYAIVIGVAYWLRRDLRPRGPKPPVHPLTSDDARLLRRRGARAQTLF
jgi:hypothetical protein